MASPSAFLYPKVGKKKSRGCDRAQIQPKIWPANPKNHIHPFLDYIVNCSLNLSILGVLVGGVGWLWMSWGSTHNSICQ